MIRKLIASALFIVIVSIGFGGAAPVNAAGIERPAEIVQAQPHPAYYYWEYFVGASGWVFRCLYSTENDAYWGYHKPHLCQTIDSPNSWVYK